MGSINEQDRVAFFRDVDTACRKAVWAAVATTEAGAPRVRLVHPTWEGEVLWFATSPTSPKARQLRTDPRIDVQYQVAPPDFVHVLVRGTAELIVDDAVRRHVWDVLDYDLSAFWPGGPADPGYAAVRITPARVELSEMFGTRNPRVWTRAG